MDETVFGLGLQGCVELRESGGLTNILGRAKDPRLAPQKQGANLGDQPLSPLTLSHESGITVDVVSVEKEQSCGQRSVSRQPSIPSARFG